MVEMIFGLVSFLIATFAFGLGIAKLFKKKKPLYLQIYVCAAGCFAIEQLSFVVNLWCRVTEPVSIGMLGIFGCNFFLLSANFGALDRIVDDGKNTENVRLMAIIAPIVMMLMIFAAFLSWENINMFNAVMWAVMLLPALPASYFNLKHILLPIDPFEFLKAAKLCNISALAFYMITAIYVVISSFGGVFVKGVLSVMMSLSVLSLTLSAIKGAKKWGI